MKLISHPRAVFFIYFLFFYWWESYWAWAIWTKNLYGTRLWDRSNPRSTSLFVPRSFNPENFLRQGAMAKNRNKKKRSGVAPMDTTEPTLTDIPQCTPFFLVVFTSTDSQFFFPENDFPALNLSTLHMQRWTRQIRLLRQPRISQILVLPLRG